MNGVNKNEYSCSIPISCSNPMPGKILVPQLLAISAIFRVQDSLVDCGLSGLIRQIVRCLQLNIAYNESAQREFTPNIEGFQSLSLFWYHSQATKLQDSFISNISRNNHTAQKMKFSIKNFFSKCDPIRKSGFGHIYRRNP